MTDRISRRMFATTTAAAAASLPVLGAARCSGATEADKSVDSSALSVRPYQLLCIICRTGAGCTEDLGDPRLTEILRRIRQNPRLPLALRCNVDTVYRYQNPGGADDTAEGELFNVKRDLDILHKLGLAPGDTRPAVDMMGRFLDKISTVRGICGYDTRTSDDWRGCEQADSGNFEKGRVLGIKAFIPARSPEEKEQSKETSVAAIRQAETLRIRPHHLLCMCCFHGGKDKIEPISEDNLFEVIDVIQKKPDIPVTLIAGVCMICPPCSLYDPAEKLCLGGHGMALRDQKKDLEVLQRLGLKYGDTLPARKLYELVFERIRSVYDVCAYGDGEVRATEWSVCDTARKDAYQKARAAWLGIPQV